MSIRKLAAGVALGALALASSTAVYAQQTTGEIRGQVTDASGKPAAGVTVTATYTASGTKATTVTGADGSYDIPNLQPGGPYTVQAIDPAGGGQKIDVDSIGLGSASTLNIALPGGSSVAEVTVTATSSGNTHIKELTTGPMTAFSSHDIDTLPSFNRDLKDLVRLSPFVTIDPTNANALVVAGTNNRFNTIYIDGVKQADDFGLNANGYPSQRSPISTDWVKAFNFEVAPYDVEYGEFQGGLLNVVTKGGSNSFHASAYYQSDNNAYSAKDFIAPANPTAGAAARDLPITPFYDQTYGATMSGPIWKDRAFLFFGYERFLNSVTPSGGTWGPAGSGAQNTVGGITQANVDQIINILKTDYHFDPLSYNLNSLPDSDEKYFARLDFNITDRQRLMLSYQQDDGSTTFNGGSTQSVKQLDLLSTFYDNVQNLKVANVELFSDWNDQFSTELAYNWKQVQTIREPLAGNSFANFSIRLDTGTTVQLGPDISSQENILNNTDQLFRFRAHYKWDNHVITAGYEREALSVFNVFDQNANGAYIFASNIATGAASGTNPACYVGSDVFANLAAGDACSLTYASAADNNKSNAAAKFSDVDNTVYLQDEWSIAPNLTVQLGVRGEWFSDTTPVTENVTGFTDIYHFSNTATFDGRGIIEPRFGFNWTPDSTSQLTGGIGLFSGGDPNVWLSNSFTNTGLLIGNVSCSLVNGSGALAGTAVGQGCVPGELTGITSVSGSPVVTGVTKTANTTSANLGTGFINVVDPHFKLPSTWKASLSYAKEFDLPYLGSDWKVHADLLWAQVNEGVTWKDLWAAANPGTPAPDGRPTYNNARFNNCNATTPGPNAHSCYALELTNDHLGGGVTWALGFGKSWSDGWAKGLDFDLTYTNQNVGEGNPGTSSVALSNYSQWAVSDRNNPVAAPSNYEIKWQAKLSVGYDRAFFGDYHTSFRFFLQDRAGFPFSYTFFAASSSTSGNTGDQAFGETQAVASRSTELLYVPKTDASGNVTATSDPLVQYASTFNVGAWNTYLHQTGLLKYAGQIAPRNAFQSPNVLTADLRLEQELPAFEPHGAKFKVWMDIINLPNLLNKHWGVLEQTSFPGAVAPVTATNCQSTAPTPIAASKVGTPTSCPSGYGNYYMYSGLFTTTNYTVNNASGWYLDFGVKYQF